MRPIPISMREELAEDPRMKQCAVYEYQDVFGTCDGRIEWDHVWIYAGKQINEPWAIVGLCHHHHYAKNGNRKLKLVIEKLSLMLTTSEDLAKYPRKDWEQIKQYGIDI
jgi:hypothetical protein